MKQTVGIVICGVAGRMGQAIAKFVEQDAQFHLAGATVRKGHSLAGQTIGNCTVATSIDDALNAIDKSSKCVVIDFTAPSEALAHAHAAAKRGFGFLLGTTGLDDKKKSGVRALANQSAIIIAANTSLGANLLGALARIAARALPQSEVEICEVHHSLKKDSPSGTAMFLGEMVAEGKNVPLQKHLVLDRHDDNPRKPDDIGIFGLRGGLVKGEHTVYLFDGTERIELTHRIADRDVFAAGALRAAAFLAKQQPGVFTMFDVLGLN